MADKGVMGLRYMRCAPLDADGGVPAAPSWVASATAIEMGYTPVTVAGQQIEGRGGDKLLYVIQEDDEVVGWDLNFRDLELNEDVWEVIEGGIWYPGSNTYVPRKLGDAPPGFIMEAYSARYEEGAQHESDLIGYLCVFFWNCRMGGGLPAFTQQDRNFAIPAFTIRARENVHDGLRAWGWKRVAALP